MLVYAAQQTESAIHIHTFPHSRTSAPNNSIPGLYAGSCHWAPRWVPYVIQQLPTSYLFYTWWYVCQCYSLSLSHFSFPPLNQRRSSISSSLMISYLLARNIKVAFQRGFFTLSAIYEYSNCFKSLLIFDCANLLFYFLPF